MENFDIKTREIEFKYSGQHILLPAFNAFAKTLNPQFFKLAASWDIYYGQTRGLDLPFEFMRLRLGQKPELTIKVKNNSSNNNDRLEIDVPLDPSKSQEEIEATATAFCEQFGFKENFRIFKVCNIFFYEKTDLVYYVTYNENLVETGRFIEPECRKDAVFSSLAEANQAVLELEERLGVLGITPQHRLKLSQWERGKR